MTYPITPVLARYHGVYFELKFKYVHVPSDKHIFSHEEQYIIHKFEFYWKMMQQQILDF